LWWAIGSTVIVLLMAWMLSMCAPAAEEATEVQTAQVGAGLIGGVGANGSSPSGQSAEGSDAPASTDSGSTESTESTESAGSAGSADAVDAAGSQAEGSNGSGGGRARGVTAGPALPDEELDSRIDEALGIDQDRGTGTIGQTDPTSADPNGDTADTGDGGDEAGSEAEVATVEAGTSINTLLELDTVTFAVRSDVVTAEGELVLDLVAAFLRANPAVSIEIEGHTDSDGAEAANLDLSQRRAESVARYLEESGIAGRRLEPVGYGESRPLVSNDSSAGKARNRRIEFTVR
jgi:outer membrane protein OmpA-like peptidoglycan-associated protein